MSPEQNDTIESDWEPVSFDEAVSSVLAFCDTLPDDFAVYRGQLAELQTRLSGGRLHFAVLGQFNRGKSTFINALLGIKVLPSSVLPLTSVPTFIEYGLESRCRIRFLDGKDDLIVNGRPEEIEKTLRQYVAEENNPKNRFHVRDARITCDSELLANGTALIDTPGFGSTYLHNTQTTFDILVECDAALFLLSADPPMTQTEMEFLRGVKERVPKIFFILNKVDLVTRTDLEEVDKFIKNILCGELGFPIDTVLYRTSAIKGEAAKRCDEDDANWVASGLEAVKRESLDFMIHEKYFTLSDALRGKYGEAVNAIKTLLEKKLGEKMAPINDARKEINVIMGSIQSLSLELESQLKKCAEEKESLDKKIVAWTKQNSVSYDISIKKALRALLNGKYFPDEAASVASTLLPKHSSDLGARFLITILELANKSIRAIVINHARALAHIQKRYVELTLENNGLLEQDAETLIERFEIDTTNRGEMFEVATWDMPPPQIKDIFRKKLTRYAAILEFYEPICVNSVSENIKKAENSAKTLINTAWKEMLSSISASHRQFIDRLSVIYKLKQSAILKNEAAAKPEIAFLRDRIKALKAHIL